MIFSDISTSEMSITPSKSKGLDGVIDIMHTAVANGHRCGAERQLCGLSGKA